MSTKSGPRFKKLIGVSMSISSKNVEKTNRYYHGHCGHLLLDGAVSKTAYIV